MVSKVTPSLQQQVYTKFTLLPKTYQVAFGVFTLMAAYAAFRIIRWAWSVKAESQPINIPELFNTATVIPDDVIEKNLKIDPTNKDQIVSDILSRVKSVAQPVCKGKDSLGHEFYFVSFKRVSDKGVCGIILSSVQVDGESEPFAHKIGVFEVGQDIGVFLKGLIKGEIKLYQLTEASQSPNVTTLPKSAFPEEIQTLLGVYLEDNNPIYYQPTILRRDVVGAEDKLVAIKDQCEKDEPFTPINFGLNAWGEPLIEISFINKEKEVLAYWVYPHEGTWYIGEKVFSTEGDEYKHLISILNGTNTNDRLIGAPQGATVHKDMFDSPLFLKLFPAWAKQPILPVFYVPTETRKDAVDPATKLDAIQQQCCKVNPPPMPINVGVDLWGNSFLEIIYFEEASNQKVFQYLYKANNDWYADESKLTDESTATLAFLIAGKHQTLKLAKPNL